MGAEGEWQGDEEDDCEEGKPGTGSEATDKDTGHGLKYGGHGVFNMLGII